MPSLPTVIYSWLEGFANIRKEKSKQDGKYLQYCK